MKVLFALGSDKLSKSIAEQYLEKYGEEIEYKNVFYFKSLLEEVKKDKTYDRIVIKEELEQFELRNLESLDRFIFNNIDNITDEIENSEIIFICSDRRTKDHDRFVERLFNIGVYNTLIGDERDVKSLCQYIKKPLNKKEAKRHLNISSLVSDDTISTRDDEVEEVQIMNILKYYENIKGKTEQYLPAFDRIAEQYNPNQLRVILFYLPQDVKREILSAERYRFLNDSEEKTNAIAENDSPIQRRPIKRGLFGFLKDGKGKETFKPKNVISAPTKQEGEVIKMEDDQETLRKQAEREAEERERQKQEELRKQAEQEAAERERQRQEELRRQENQRNQTEQESIVIDNNIIQDESKNENEGMNHEVEIEKNDPIREEIKRIAHQQEELRKQEKMQKEKERQESHQEALRKQIEEQEALQKEQEELKKKAMEEEQKAQMDVLNEQKRIDEERKRLEKEKEELEKAKKKLQEQSEKFSKDAEKMIASQVANTSEEIVSGDLKRMVIFVGANKSGTTFITNAVSHYLASKNIPVGLLDMTRDKSTYYLYNQNDKAMRSIASECMQKLNEGIDVYIPALKNMKVYTSIPEPSVGRKNYKNRVIIETVREANSVVIIDADFTTPLEFFEKAEAIYIVQDMDILKMQEMTYFLRDLKSKSIAMNKIRVVINKFVKSMLTPKAMMDGLSTYIDPQMSYMDEVLDSKTTKYIVPFNVDNYVKYIDGVYSNNINFKKFSSDFSEAIEEIGNSIYKKNETTPKRRGFFR